MSKLYSGPPYQIVIADDKYLLESENSRYEDKPTNIGIKSAIEFLEDIVDREVSIRKHTNFCGGYWDANFSWEDFLDDICVSRYVLEELSEDDDGDLWLQVRYEMSLDKIYYYTSYSSMAQGDSGQRLNSNQQDAWNFG